MKQLTSKVAEVAGGGEGKGGSLRCAVTCKTAGLGGIFFFCQEKLSSLKLVCHAAV